ncbi:MAG: ribosomal protein L7/L12 [Anaerolineaceae bacterium]|nr:ribosomal protein L7/L12 [Anaerolineaceae bacterium]
MASTFNCPSCGAPLDYPGSGDTMHCPYCHESVIVPEELRLPASAAQMAGAAGQLMEVRRLAQSGQTLEAIKLFRQMTGASLSEAQRAVDGLQAGYPQPAMSTPQFHGAGFTAAGLTTDQTALIQGLCAGGRKIEAIKLYRQITNVGLAEAKTAVESIAAGVQPSSAPVAKKKGFNLIMLAFGALMLGVASIFPLVFIPMGISSIQQGDVGGAIGSFIGAGVWALAWGAIGVILVMSSFG